MSKSLVIVESPSKAKTIGKYLGASYIVKASVGHVRDLPPSQMGVDVENDFEPSYTIIKGKKKVIDEIKKAADSCDSVFLATDPDREGEAIAYHIAYELNKGKKKHEVHRVLFNEITKKTVLESIQHPIEINFDLFNAQQARRILDRLVGYKVSPLLWEKVRRGLSAGRVQSVAVRIICEREEEIKAFVSIEYWSLLADLEGSVAPNFQAKLHKLDQENAVINNEKENHDLIEELKKEKFILSQVVKKERKRNPAPPFITSTLQQEASRKLGFTAKKTMRGAQILYEGVELEDGESTGLITYMRTDSVRISDDAAHAAREFIAQKYGKEFLPDAVRVFKTKKSSQDAHEAIRPTSMENTPERVKPFLEKDEFRLYELIWKRFLACQMSQAIYDQTSFDIIAGRALFRASGSILKFAGFTQVYLEDVDEKDLDDDEGKKLPDLKEGEELKVLNLEGKQHFTEPPPRYTEASLVKKLEELGVGRPSTYASILSTIVDKKYCEKIEKKFRPTQLGTVVNQLLVESFPDLINVSFTAEMEEKLDDIEEGKRLWKQTLKEFYDPFEKTLVHAKENMTNLKRQEIATEFKCEKCSSPMVVKWGRHGEFLACSSYPDCKSTKEITRNEKGGIEIQKEESTEEVCDKCQSPMAVKRGRFGSFLACSAYPSCKNTKAISIGVNCPECSSPLAERKSKRGRSFYGCTGYPKCNFALWDKPVNEACPQCGAKFLVHKVSKKDGNKISCYDKDCGYSKTLETDE